jgi:hypothetical protein
MDTLNATFGVGRVLPLDHNEMNQIISEVLYPAGFRHIPVPEAEMQEAALEFAGVSPIINATVYGRDLREYERFLKEVSFDSKRLSNEFIIDIGSGLSKVPDQLSKRSRVNAIGVDFIFHPRFRFLRTAAGDGSYFEMAKSLKLDEYNPDNPNPTPTPCTPDASQIQLVQDQISVAYNSLITLRLERWPAVGNITTSPEAVRAACQTHGSMNPLISPIILTSPRRLQPARI